METSFNVPPIKEGSSVKFPSIEVNPNYNPFSADKKINVKENLNLIKNNFQNHMLGSENSIEQNYLMKVLIYLQLGIGI